MKVIVIEDNPDHFEIIEDAFASITEIHAQVVRADTLAAGKSMLFSQHFDICLCDLQLPDSAIEQTVEWLSSQTHPLPMVTLTSLHSIEIAQNLLHKGVQDYLSKDELTPLLLYKTCRYAIERFRHQQEIAGYNQDMQVFCDSLSHDFNGHINRIKGVSGALKSDLMERTPCTANELQWFDYLEKSTSEVQNLVSDLQSYLSVGYVNQVFETVNLKLVVDKVVASLKSTLQIDFEANMPNELATISGNTALLQLLFQNLIANSIKFNNDRPIIDITMQDNGNYVDIILQDNGIGFDPVHAKKIFSPFNRLANGKKFSGSGLGLSIVKRIIAHHDGSIEAHSALGVGSKFTLKFLKK
ncbi:hybrid sensor histidine kinase/response regulator [Colwellia sp. C1TZA3]|uniref:hybrid sensor histidine kinase/response regulator n=1 Tax=Colwellia sp. C1TZA3 TaxID=2508879 RepID=UPI0011B9A5FB|nr:hybrid sensor histidine kinase/response regulator [Colwellia sp. C1TZA3]TWX73619.1 response regulator [Colwellia sp. C1TZA3]